MKFEFQYSERDDISHFDFKVSKVGKKKKGKRIPHKDREFLYIVKPGARFGILSPAWIASHGQEAGVPAWGNRTAFRVPKDVFLPALKTDENLVEFLKNIEIKNDLLEFQSAFLAQEMEKISRALQQVVDEKEILKIHLEQNEYASAKKTLLDIRSYVENSYRRGRFETSPALSPRNEARSFLFIINLLEDMTQEAVHYYDLDLKPVEKIFEILDDPQATHEICFPSQ